MVGSLSEMQHKLATGPKAIQPIGLIAFFGLLPITRGLPRPLGSNWCQAAPLHQASAVWICASYSTAHLGRRSAWGSAPGTAVGGALRGLCDRRLCPPDRGLEGEHVGHCRFCSGCLGAGDPCPQAGAGRWSLQDRGHLAAAIMAKCLSSGNGNPALGTLVQQPAAIRPNRLHPIHRGRDKLPCRQGDPRYGRVTQLKWPPESPECFRGTNPISSSTIVLAA